MSNEIFQRRRAALENEFFAKKNLAALEEVRRLLHATDTREALKTLTGIEDTDLLDTLASLHDAHDTLAAFTLYPLIEVAWADGKVDDKEREAFLRAAASLGLAEGTAGHEALRHFLMEIPQDAAREAWYAWAAEINQKLDPVERRKLRNSILVRARSVAEASGGLLGLGNRVSESEQRVLDRIAAALVD